MWSKEQILAFQTAKDTQDETAKQKRERILKNPCRLKSSKSKNRNTHLQPKKKKRK